ncbi:Uncharacterized membrane protein affecting hemolysin expression [Pseudidiomarina indica]|uniref:Uncharacterized membrane protein affecting hemolysin expression n=1 Tax=Pseudidiomarina indica TaxID=1159017 RepID=A0A1G6E1M9_9GAMM|nr:hypothetical protein [Pseudidiomarina indica]SDB51260.1 Uncharacterized membrane protein affecting hemolysin expression [Pseudidiomarina indica]
MLKVPDHVTNIFKLIYRSGRRLALAIILIVLIEQFWGSMQSTSLRELQSYSHQLMSLTAQQAAAEARHWIHDNDATNLESLIEQLHQQPFIVGAQIHDRYGQLIVSTAPHQAELHSPSTLVLVEEIQAGARHDGYLTLFIDEQALLEQPVRIHQYLAFYGQFLLGFALIAGIFIAFTYHRWRYRQPTSISQPE